MKSKNKKMITIEDKKPCTKFAGKKMFINNVSDMSYIDSNEAGNVFLLREERSLIQKWEFQVTDQAGYYYLKNCLTELYLTSDEIGNLFTTIGCSNSFQIWKFMATSDPELNVITNLGNGLVIDNSMINKIFTNELTGGDYEDASKKNILFKVIPSYPKKK
jgi:hypothetical protein